MKFRRKMARPAVLMSGLLSLALWLPAAHAQVRTIAPDAKVGTLEMKVFPDATIDGESVRFGAGARILNHDNRSITPGSVSDSARIAYKLDFQGLVHTVWLINESEEQALKESQGASKN